MSAAIGWTFIAYPMGIASEWQTIRQVMLLWRILPETELPSFASSRLTAMNGSSGRFLRQKVLPLARSPPAQVTAFAQSRGTRAKTDRIDAELIARFFAFRPEAGRSLPAEKLRLLRAVTSKTAQLVEMRKRLRVQIRAHQKLGTAAMFEDVDTELKQRIDSIIKELEDTITKAIATDDRLSETAMILRSIPGVGPVASAMLIAEMPEIGTITGEEAVALTELAPVADDSGTLRGKRAIAGGRRAMRHVMFQAALVAAHHNPSLRAFEDRIRKAGKPHKVIITAVARKLVTIPNALCKSRQKWVASTS